MFEKKGEKSDSSSTLKVKKGGIKATVEICVSHFFQLQLSTKLSKVYSIEHVKNTLKLSFI